MSTQTFLQLVLLQLTADVQAGAGGQVVCLLVAGVQ